MRLILSLLIGVSLFTGAVGFIDSLFQGDIIDLPLKIIGLIVIIAVTALGYRGYKDTTKNHYPG